VFSLSPDYLSVYVTSPRWLDRGLAFAHHHGLQCYQSDDWKTASTPYVLFYDEGAVSLAQTGKGVPGPITASFLQGKVRHRLLYGGGKGQLIAKAVGLKPGIQAHILDATAGLGRDAFVLASLNQSVMMLERSALVAELLECALLDAEQQRELQDIMARMTLQRVDAMSWLSEPGAAMYDVIYLDPMYPESTKSAQVKKEMRAFHHVVGQDADSARLLDLALEKARYRVVVKRPRKGACLDSRKPTLQLMGKSSRYDIYTLASMDGLKVRDS